MDKNRNAIQDRLYPEQIGDNKDRRLVIMRKANVSGELADLKIRDMDLSGCEEIGRGQCGRILRISDDRVVKLFFETIPREDILREYAQTIEAQKLKIHSASCFGLVRSEGKLGLELELVKGGSIQDELLKHPGSAREYGRKMAEELKLLHTKKPDPKLFPPIHEFYLSCTENCLRDGWITSEEAQKITKLIRAVPVCNTMIHGDYHIMNIMIHEGQIRLIDMADCKSGHPIFDLMITNLYLHLVAESRAEEFHALFKISQEESLALWDQFVRTYFETEDKRQIAAVNDILNVYSLLKDMLAPYSYDNMDKSLYRMFVDMGRQGLMPKIDHYMGVIPEMIADLGKQNIE